MFHPEIPDLVAARERLAAGRLAPHEPTELAAARIAAHEGRVRAFLHLDLEGALAAARTAPVGADLGGIPLGVKDIVDVAGMPTTGGSRAYRLEPDRDATAVARWRAAGAVLLGKTNTQELAYGVVTAPTRNPWRLDRIPGGSSGGSAAAVAAGMALGALGTDTGGSIRIPAACCGVVGFKPSYGAVSADGVMPLSWTLDHVGPLAHSVRDAAWLYDVLRGVPPRLRTPLAPGPHRAAVPWDYLRGRLAPAVERAFGEALDVFRRAGFRVTAVPMEPWEEWRDLQLTIRLPEAYLVHQEVLEGPRRALLGGDLADRLDPGGRIRALDYVRAQRRRLELRARWLERARDFDVVLLPTLATGAPPVGAETVRVGDGDLSLWEAMVRLTAPWNVLGWPAVSVPAGFDDDGLPVGLQVVAPEGQDETALAAALWYEDETAWTRRMPPLAD
ncbi:MAG: amidase [Actinomycetia bacterium]|nr:amidase [Actinomycetes bacterium]